MSGVRARVRGAVLTLGAVLGAGCLVAAVAGVALDARPLVVRSGSMAPTMEAGALAWVHEVDAGELRIGDAVAVHTASGSLVTHRIVDLTVDPAGATLRLQGDANPTPDPEPYRVSTAERVVLVVPWLGHVVSWLSGPAGRALLLLYTAYLLVELFRRPADAARHRAHRARARPRPVPGVLAVGLLVAAVAVGRPAPAAAAWADQVPVSEATLTAIVPSATTVSCQALQGPAVAITWTPVIGATGYRLHYGSSGSTTENVSASTLSKTFTGLTSGTFSVEAAFGSTSWLSATSNSVGYAVLALTGTCG